MNSKCVSNRHWTRRPSLSKHRPLALPHHEYFPSVPVTTARFALLDARLKRLTPGKGLEISTCHVLFTVANAASSPLFETAMQPTFQTRVLLGSSSKRRSA